MIIGLGNDIAEKSRIGAIFAKYKGKFLQKILSAGEQKELSLINCPTKRLGRISNLFAAKEAFAKATGLGIGQWHKSQGVMLQFTDIAILHDEYGKAYIDLPASLCARLFSRASQASRAKFHLSLTDSKDYSFATVIIEQLEESPKKPKERQH